MISLRGATQRFGSRVVLDDVTFTFDRDRVYVLQGPSGTGKSTLLNLIAGYLPLTSGTITCDGSVEYLLQDELLFSQLTIAQNLRIRTARQDPDGTGDADPLVERALSALGLGGRAEAQVFRLSGGERRRVELAGMLMSEPAVLLLDEPVGNLDPLNARDVYDALWDIRAGRALVIVTHERDLGAMPGPVERLILIDGRLTRG